MNGVELTWVARTPNRKTDDIPTAYVGATVAEARASCEGCALLERTCYAWKGFANVSFPKIVERRRADPARYSIERALEGRWKGARAIRIGAMGDPSSADRAALLRAVALAATAGLATISYTHFWREERAAGLEGLCMASCEDVDDADDAIAAGWTPAVILPWDHVREVGPTFVLPSGGLGVVCPAQTKGTTCNDCRMCWLGHPVWTAGKVAAIGFVDHSGAARRERIRANGGRQLPMFGERAVDVRPSSRPKNPKAELPPGTCPVCGNEVIQDGLGRPRIYCTRRCGLKAVDRKRRGVPIANAPKAEASCPA